MRAHGIDPTRELDRAEDRDSAPGRHAGQIGILGHDEQRPDLRGEVEHPGVPTTAIRTRAAFSSMCGGGHEI